MSKQMDTPLYLSLYVGGAPVMMRWPYVTSKREHSRKSKMPLGEEQSKDMRWHLLCASSATN